MALGMYPWRPATSPSAIAAYPALALAPNLSINSKDNWREYDQFPFVLILYPRISSKSKSSSSSDAAADAGAAWPFDPCPLPSSTADEVFGHKLPLENPQIQVPFNMVQAYTKFPY